MQRYDIFRLKYEMACADVPPPQTKMEKKYYSGNYCVKFGHFVNFSYVYFRAIISCLRSQMSSYTYAFLYSDGTLNYCNECTRATCNRLSKLLAVGSLTKTALVVLIYGRSLSQIRQMEAVDAPHTEL